MPQIQYAHGTAFGTFYVECDIIKSENDMFLIEFYDEMIDDRDQRWVRRDQLQFPKFSEYGTL